MSDDLQTLPLFPLRTVLVPGAMLGLRIFEPRYMDLVRESSRNAHGFGVCLLIDGEGDQAGTQTAAIGTQARIEDFGTGADGLLTLRVRGAQRFHVRHTRVRDNGLVMAQVNWCATDGGDALRAEHGLLSLVLRRILEQAGGEHAEAPQAYFDDAAWVGWRLAELLPLSDIQRQGLLQLDDPHARLDELLALMPDDAGEG